MKKKLLVALLLCFAAPNMIADAEAASHRKIRKQKCAPKRHIKKVKSTKKATSSKRASAATVAKSPKKSQATTISADPKPPVQPVAASTNNDQWGGYIGFNTGYSQVSGTQYAAVNADNGSTDRDMKAGLSAGGLAFDVNIGWLFKLSNFGLRLEFYYDPTQIRSKATTDLTDSGDNEHLIVNFKSTFGFISKIGYFVTPDLFPYFRLGLVTQKMTLDYRDGPGGNTPAVNKNLKTTGISTGLGIRYTVTSNIALQGEYRVTLCQSKTASVSSGANSSLVKVQPHIHDLRIGAAYLF